MAYNYDEMKKQIRMRHITAMGENVSESKRDVMTHGDLTKNVPGDCWIHLACIDYLITKGVLKVLRGHGFRQHWVYEVVRK